MKSWKVREQFKIDSAVRLEESIEEFQSHFIFPKWDCQDVR